jgi:hypothetical protein
MPNQYTIGLVKSIQKLDLYDKYPYIVSRETIYGYLGRLYVYI